MTRSWIDPQKAIRRIVMGWGTVLAVLGGLGFLYGLQGWWLALHLFVLTFSGLCIFWPMTRSIAREIRQSNLSHRLMMEQRKELEESRLAAFSIMEDAQLAQRESAEGRAAFARLAAIVESTDDAIIGKTMEGIITSWNRAAENLYGYRAEEVIGKSVEIIVPVDRHSELSEFLLLLRRGQKVVNYETVRRKKNGRSVDVSLTISPINGPRGELIGASSIARDITELKQAREALADREKWFRALVEHGMDIIMKLDDKGTVLYVSPPLTRALGYSVEEWTGKNLFDFMHPNDVGPSVKILNDILKQHKEITRGQARFLHKNGEWRWMEGTGQNLLQEAGIQAVVVNCRDITDRKTAEARLIQFTNKLKQSNKELEQFAFVASHDLQEPLRIVSSYVQLWSRRYTGTVDETAKRYMSYITSNVQRMQNMIEALLEYSRVNQEMAPLHAVDAGKACDQALTNLQMAIRSKNAVVTRDNLPVILGSDVQLIQLFQNFVGNAIKYCQTQPKVHVSARLQNDEWIFSVKDNGIGIDPVYHDKIFDVFRRLHTKEEYQGTGIGLAICKKIVEKYHGRIWVESREHQGSTFYFAFPNNLGTVAKCPDARHARMSAQAAVVGTPYKRARE